MAFTLEDGTGVASANAYISEAFVLAYLTDRGRETENSWDTATVAAQQSAIIKATDYVEKRFRSRWRGNKLTAAQGLAWPREDAFDDDGFEFASDAVPDKLAQGVAEYTVRALAATLLPDPTPPGDNTSGVVTRLKEKIGPLEVDTTYADRQRLASEELRAYPAADLLISYVVHVSGMFGRVGRA